MIRHLFITLACAVALALTGCAMTATRKRPDCFLNREASGLLAVIAIALFLSGVFGVCAMVAP